LESEAISVIIPYYNAHSTVETALSSVLRSTQKVREIVIVDDGSGYSSKEILREILERLGDERIKLVEHPFNLGGGAARNSAISNSHSDWIFCLDADNVVPPSLLSELMQCASSTNSSAQVFAPETIVFFSNSDLKVTHAWRMDVDRLSFDDFVSQAIIPAASGNYLFTRESWERSGGYPTRSGALDAWGFGLRQFSSGYPPTIVPGTLYFHRVGTESYFVRESARPSEMSIRATSLLLECISAETNSTLRSILRWGRAWRWFGSLKNSTLLQRGIKGRGGYRLVPNEFEAANLLNAQSALENSLRL
jgi:glycosyltransferase involved in cell wall biosynthesis